MRTRQVRSYDFTDHDQESQYLLNNGEWKSTCFYDSLLHGWYATEAEAAFRLLLYQSPREALSDFLTAEELEWECSDCINWVPHPCQTCDHGHGSPPAPHLLAAAADWHYERGDQMRGDVLKGMLTQSAALWTTMGTITTAQITRLTRTTSTSTGEMPTRAFHRNSGSTSKT